jgi:hypothetical protein
MRIGKQRAGRRRELIVAGLFKAQVKPLAPILGVSRALYALDVVLAALNAADYAIRPAHLLNVGQALLIGGELLGGSRIFITHSFMSYLGQGETSG